MCTAVEQTTIYWQVRRAWIDRQVAEIEHWTFGGAVEVLRTIIVNPATPKLKQLAQSLLDDIVNHADSPSIPEDDPYVPDEEDDVETRALFCLLQQ